MFFLFLPAGQRGYGAMSQSVLYVQLGLSCLAAAGWYGPVGHIDMRPSTASWWVCAVDCWNPLTATLCLVVQSVYSWIASTASGLLSRHSFSVGSRTAPPSWEISGCRVLY